MRRLTLPIALALLVAGTLPALADGGGLPEIASLQAGPFTVSVQNDNPTLVTGANMLTVEVPSLPDRHAVSLSLTGPRGERLDVPLQAVRVLDGPESEHAHEVTATASHASMPGMSHDMPGMTHDAAPAPASPAADAHGDSSHLTGGSTYLARGTVSVGETGAWQAHVRIAEEGGLSFAAEAPLVAQDGGPSLLYLVGAGSLIVGFLLYGAIQRRQPIPAKAR